MIRSPTEEPLHAFPHWVDDDPAPDTLALFPEGFNASPASSHQESQQDSSTAATFKAKHLILLHHAETTMEGYMLGAGLLRPMVDIAVDWVIKAPYVMDQLLALSADHLALLSPDEAKSYRHTATELQTRAIEVFHKHLENLTEEDMDKACVPRFLFASLLSVHVLYETYAYYRTNFQVFLDRFVQSIHVHRGVRTIINNTYPLILKSSLRQSLIDVRNAEAMGINGTECNELGRFIERSDLGPATSHGCKEAVKSLQWAFDLQAALGGQDGVRAGTAYPVLLSLEFIDALRKPQPEALIILAHYGVLLHRCRDSWIFGDAGAYLIHLIADHLGPFWQEPMQWPLEVLSTEND